MATPNTYQSQVEITEVVQIVRTRLAFGETPADWSDLEARYGASMLFFAYQGVKLLDS